MAGSRPMYRASQMTACPMDTSSVQGIVLMKYSRFSRLRSCPAFSPIPHSRTVSAVFRNGAYRGFLPAVYILAYDSV